MLGAYLVDSEARQPTHSAHSAKYKLCNPGLHNWCYLTVQSPSFFMCEVGWQKMVPTSYGYFEDYVSWYVESS